MTHPRTAHKPLVRFGRNRSALRLVAATILCAGLPPLAAETAAPSLEEISVTTVRSADRALQPGLVLDKTYFRRTVPTDFNEAFRAVLGVGIRTNSRGEAVLRLRGSEERQSQVFIDGAPISVPWDGRTDLSLFPASLIREVTVIKSAAPIEYGANAVLGVVDISTLETSDHLIVSARSEVGTHGSFLAEGEAYIPVGNIGLQLGANQFSRDAISVASEDPIAFDPLEGDGRTNTDLESTSLFAAATIDEAWGTVRVSAMDIEAEKGIAAAAHIDPDEGDPRFWRYPDWHLTQISLAADIALDDSLTLRTNAWHQRFNQSIVSYSDISYRAAEDQQDDRDRTYGGRIVLSKDWPLLTTRLVASMQQSTHDQLETDLVAATPGDSERFRQRLTSLGGEIDLPLGDSVKSSVALAYDRTSTPLTGGRPNQPALSKWAASGTLAWQANTDLKVTASLGQRTRFPTMRELYGTALGRFLLNPDLKPETSLMADLTFEWTPQDLPLSVTVTPWITRIDDTLSRRNVTTDGAVLRQRFNLDGSRGIGIEAGAVWQASDSLTFEANGFWQDLRADRDTDGIRPVLYQRPESQVLMAANYTLSGGANLRAEMNHTGRALDEAEDGTVTALNRSTEFNVKFYVPVAKSRFGVWQIYGALNNITDDVVLPQLGLPDAGRTFKVGIRLTDG